MPKFNKGDRVRVSLASHSPYKGQTGMVDDNPSSYSPPSAHTSGFWYMVRFDWKGLHPAARFMEEELEAVTDEITQEETPAPVKFTGRSRWTIGNKVIHVSTMRKYLFVAIAAVVILTGILVALNNTGEETNSLTSSGFTTTPTNPSSPDQGSPAGATKLAFAAELSEATAGLALPIQPVVKIEDANGDIVTDSTATVTLIVSDDMAMLYGTTTVNAVNGVATFTDLSIRLAGFHYSLTAISPGLTSSFSNSFNVSHGEAARLVFVTKPAGSGLGSYFSTLVAILDKYGNIATDSTAEVTLAITPGSGAPGAILSGVTDQIAINGVATFGYLSISPTDSDYRLTATSPGLIPAISSSFNVAEITKKQESQ